jgi:hypothetical protein
MMRLFVSALAAVATFYFLFWIPFSMLFAHGPDWLPGVLSLAGAVTVARFVWRNASSPAPGLARSAALGALLVGGVGFVAGFFGPLILAPGANQGPLLGIFITGPLGALAGAGAGWAYWIRRRERTS